MDTISALENVDIRLALVEYRDHPLNENDFVTRVNNFTDSVSEMRGWLLNCIADKGLYMMNMLSTSHQY